MENSGFWYMILLNKINNLIEDFWSCQETKKYIFLIWYTK